MAISVDLEGPLQDLLTRTSQLRAIMALVELSARNPASVTVPARSTLDLSVIGGATTNTANSMCIVFLASSFEEFFRELVSQSGQQFAHSYTTIPEAARLAAKGSYWEACLDSLKFAKKILTKDQPRSLDGDVVAKARSILESARGFVLLDDTNAIDGKIFSHHSRNFKPVVVEEISGRIGIRNIMRRVSDSNRLRRHFGVTTIAEVQPKLVSKLNGFYQTRNDIVHSLNGSTGFGISYVNDHIDLIEGFSESLKNVFERHLTTWTASAA